VKKAAAYDVLIEKLKPLEPDATRDSEVKEIKIEPQPPSL
jgi:hypothetical protein